MPDKIKSSETPMVLQLAPDQGDMSKILYADEYSGSSLRGRVADESQYDKNFNETRYTTDQERFEHRIEAQGWGSELTNAVLGGLAKVPATIVGTVGNLVDLENYKSIATGAGNDYDNSLTSAMNQINKSIDEYTPIYGSQTESGFSALANREWWMEMAKSTIESGTAFAITGMGIGAGLNALGTAGALRAASAVNKARAASGFMRGVIGEANAIAYKNTAQGLSTLTTSALLTHAEGVQLAAQVFDNAYQIHYQDYFKNNPNENPDELDSQTRAENYATDRASVNAATAHRVNMFNIALNLTSINRMITPVKMSREASKKATVAGVTKEWLAEGGQEYLEENVNNVAENIAISDAKGEEKHGFVTAMDSIFSAEGFTAGVSGFMGGVFQTGVTDAKKYLAGDFKKQNEHYKEFLVNEDKLNSVAGQKNVLDSIQNGKYTIDKFEEISNLENAGHKEKALTAKKELLQFQALQAFKAGNGEQFEKVLDDSISQLQKDPNISASERDNQAQEIKKAFKEAEEIYNETLFQVSPDKQEDMYFNTVNRKNLEKEKATINIEKAKAKMNLLSNLENLKFVGLGKSQTGIQREFQQKLSSVLGGVYENSVQKIKALAEVQQYHDEKGAITYPGQEDYLQSVAKLAANELAMSKNIQDYNAIIKGTYTEQKIKESKKAVKGNEAVKATEAALKKEGDYEVAKQEAKQTVEAPVDLEAMFGGATEALAKPEVTTEVAPVEPSAPVITINPENPKTEIVTSHEDLKKDNQIFVSPTGKFGILAEGNIKFYNTIEEAEHALYNPGIKESTKVEDQNTPAPKNLLPEELIEFKDNLYKGNLDTVAEDGVISVDNPSDGFYDKKIINGHNAVAIKTVDTILDSAGNFIKNSDTYLENTNQNVLSNNGVVDRGTKLYIKPTPGLFKGDGSENPTGTPNQEFGIYTAEGSLVGYVHEVDWCTDKTIAHERPELEGNIERNRALLQSFREAITKDFNDGLTAVEVQISSKSSGSANHSKKVDTISNKTIDPNTKASDSRVVLAVIKNDGFYINDTKVDDYLAKDKSSLDFIDDAKFFNKYQGMSVMIVPSPARNEAGGTSYKVVFLEGTSVLPKNIMDSIQTVLGAYLSEDEALLKSFGIDNTKAAVQKYVNQFFYSSAYNDNGNNPHYFVVDEGTKGRNIKANTINGTQISLMYIGAKTDVTANIASALEGRKFNLNLSSNQNGTKIQFLENGKVVSKAYEQVAKDLSLTTLEAMPLTNINNEVAYFHNPVLQFDVNEGILEKKVEEGATETTPTGTVFATKKRVLKAKPVAPETAPIPVSLNKGNTSSSDLEDKTYTVTGLVTDKTTGEFIEITRVNDITDTIYNFIVSKYLTDNRLKPKEGLDRFRNYAQENYEFYDQFSDIEFELGAEELAAGSLPTHEANAKRAADWKQVVDNLEELIPIALEKLEVSGFNFEGDYTSEIEKEKFGASSFELDPITKLSGKMKAFMKSIKADRLNFLGEHSYVDFQNLHNKVMSLLSNRFLSYKETVEELKKSKDGAVIQVVQKLEDADQTLKNEFLFHFSKEYAEFITAKEGKTFNPNRESLTQIVYNDFIAGVQNKISTTLENGSSKITLSEEAKSLWSDIANSENPSVELVSRYLESIGMTVNKATLETMKQYMGTPSFEKQHNIRSAWSFQFGNKSNARNNGLFGNIHSALIKKDGQEIPLDDEQSYVKESVLDKENAFKKLASVESQYRESDISPSFVNGEGKTLYGFTLPNAVAIRLSRLKSNANNLVESLKQISFTKHASWLNQVNDFNFKLFYFDVNDFTGNKEYAKSFHEMSDEQKAKTRITLFTSLMEGSSDNFVTRFISSAKSDKTKAVGVQYNKWKVSFTGDQISDATLEQVSAIAYAEYDRILNAQAREMKKIEGYNPNLFYLIPSLNEVEKLFYNEGKIEPNRETAKLLIKEAVRTFLQNEINFTKEKLQEYKIASEKKLFEVDSAYREYMSKYKSPQVSEIDFLAADFTVNQLLANYNYNALFTGDPALAFKKDKKNPTVMNNVKATLDNYFKRLAKDVAPAQRLANSNSASINQIFINDPEGALAISKNINQLKAILGDNADVYSKIDIADAQEYTSLQEHLDNLLLQGDLDQSIYDRLSDKIKVADSTNTDVHFTPSELTTVLQPIKPVYVYNKADTLNDVDHTFYIKSSSFPLVPQLVKGSNLYNLMKAMQENGIHRAAMMSAAKLGAVNPLNFEDIKADSDLKSNISVLPREGYGIQQPVPYDETKTEILQGSQLQRLIFEGLGEGFNKLRKEFDALQMQLFSEDFAELKEDFGIEEASNGDLSIKDGDMSKFVEVLTDELKSRNYNPNDLDGLRLDANGKLEIPLWFNSNATRMESIILSLFTNRILKQKLRGKSYVLGSELGLEEDLTSTQKSDIIYTSSYDPKTGLLPQRIIDKDGNVIIDAKVLESLKTMTEEELTASGYIVKGSQVLLAANFTDNQGKKIPLSKFTRIVNGKAVIDMSKIPAELLTSIGYRIPTQGHNSMAYIEVVGFLPEYMADLIIASKDFTKQMGSDFDIDKLYIHSSYTHLQEDGNLVKDNFQEARNGIIDTYKKVLSDPRVFHKIITPLDFGELENVNKNLKKISRFNKPQRSILSPWQQDNNFSTGTAGKMGVSQTSILSTFSSLLQGNKASVKAITVKVANILVDLTDISSPNSVTGRPKIAIISAFQSASVDNIKELLINTVNYNEHTNPALTSLALVGLDEHFISYLFTQDAVMEFVEDARNNFLGKPALDLVLEKINNTKTKDTPQILTEAEIKHILENPEPFSAEELYQNLHVTDKSKDYFIKQLTIAAFFDDVTSTGKQLLAEQAPVNLYTGGYTNNTLSLNDKLVKLDSGENVSGVTSLLGKVVGQDSYGLPIVNPTTPSGLGYEIGRKAHSLMNKLFPYTSSLVTTLQSKISIPKKNVKVLHDFIKSSLISTSNIFQEDLSALRNRLLFGDDSLAHRWNEFKAVNPAHALGKRLELKLSNSATYPSTIKYTLTSGTRSDDFNVVKTLVEMLNNPATSILAEDTIKYLMMNGGIQLPNNFVKLIPNDYLIKNDFGKDLISRVNDRTFTELVAPIIEKQFIQHNTKYAVNVPFDDVKPLSQERIVTPLEVSSRFITVKEEVEGNKFITKLYERTPDFHKNENPIYIRIPVLGKGSVVEANIDAPNKPSIFTDNNPKEIIPIGVVQPLAPIVKNPNPEVNSDLRELGLQEFGEGKEYLKSVMEKLMKTSDVKAHKALAQVFLKLIDMFPANIKISIVPQITKLAPTGQTSGGLYYHDTNLIEVKASLDRTNLERILLHELIHAATTNAILGKVPVSDKAQTIIKSLERLFETAREKYNQLNPEIKQTTGRDVYGLYNLEEFITEALTKTAFQQTLSNLEFGDKTVLERLRELISKLIEAMLPSDFHKVSGISTDYLDAVVKDSLELFTELSAPPAKTEEIIPLAPPAGLEGLFLTDEDMKEAGLTKKDVSSATEEILSTREEVSKKAKALTTEWKTALKKSPKVDLYKHYLQLVNTLNRSNYSKAALKVTKNPTGNYTIETVDVVKPENITIGTYYKMSNSFQDISKEQLNSIMEKIDKFEDSPNQEGLILKELCK